MRRRDEDRRLFGRIHLLGARRRIAHFLTQLEDALSKLGQAVSFEFQALERGFAFEIEMGRGGHVDGKYRFERDWRGPCLSGSFTADQTHLGAWAKELRSALAT
jgi:hypothetical protein